MDSILYANLRLSVPLPTVIPAADRHFSSCLPAFPSPFLLSSSSICRRHFSKSIRPAAAAPSYASSGTANSNSMPIKSIRPAAAAPSYAISGIANSNFMHPRDRTYNVSDFMTRKDKLHVVKTYTTVEDALETLVDKRITGFPVIDDDWKLVGVVSDYDLLALDSISGAGQADTNLFPDVDSTWKIFSELQKLLGKTKGKVVGDLMTPSPLAVQENTNLGDAARLLLETKYRRLPVVDNDGKLVGIITRGDVIRAALQIKRASEKI